MSEVEATFRSLKSELGLRPIYHRTRKWVQGAFADIGTGLSGGPYAAHDVASSGRNDELAEDPSHAGEHSSDHDSDGRVEVDVVWRYVRIHSRVPGSAGYSGRWGRKSVWIKR